MRPSAAIVPHPGGAGDPGAHGVGMYLLISPPVGRWTRPREESEGLAAGLLADMLRLTAWHGRVLSLLLRSQVSELRFQR